MLCGRAVLLMFNPVWGLLWVVPASMEYHGVFDEMKKANIYAPMMLHDTQ
jgi:hypothetical protein